MFPIFLGHFCPPDPDPGTLLNPDPTRIWKRIRIYNTKDNTCDHFYDLKVTKKCEVVWVACLIESVKTVSILAMRTWRPLIMAITSMSANFSSLE
jgi:hypothetical protein